MTARVFVDTNVLVYARDSSEPAKQQLAAAWLEQLWHERSGRISVQALSEFFVTVTHKLKPGLSADLQDGGVYGNVEVRSPFSTKVSEPTVRYAAVAATARRHPPRGRPKRSA